MQPFLIFLLLAFALPLAAAELDEARSLIKAKRVPEARPILERFLVEQPQNVDALLLLGSCQAMMQQAKQAVETYEKAIALAGSRTDLLSSYGQLCLELAAKERSVSLVRKGRNALEKALELDPSLTLARQALITYYSDAPWIAGGSMDKAFAHARELRKIDVQLGLVLLVSLNIKEKKFTEAFSLCDEAMKSNPDDYAVLYELGRLVSLTQTRTAEGLAALQKCLTLTPPPGAPGHAGAYYRMGLIHQNMKEFTTAQKDFENAVRLDPKNEIFKTALAKVAQATQS